MYTFSSKLKTFSFILIILGVLGIGYGFLTAPKNIEEVEKILAANEHGGHHAAAGHAAAEGNDHAKAEAHTAAEVVAEEPAVAEVVKDTTASDTTKVVETVAAPAETHKEVKPTKEVSEEDAHKEHQAHLEHVLHQLQNKPWSALYVACIFFMLITMGVLAFYAIQQVAQAGWSPVLFRVMQGITAYLPVGSVIFFVLLL